jgi:hypothetical protein
MTLSALEHPPTETTRAEQFTIEQAVVRVSTGSAGTERPPAVGSANAG